MRNTTTWLNHDFVFTQQSLLTPREFLSKAMDRRMGIPLSGEGQLEVLHRKGILVPLYRVRKDTRGMTKRAPQEDVLAYTEFLSVPKTAPGLRLLREQKQLIDPRRERFRPWHHYVRTLGDISIETSEFLYSPYQLLLLHQLRNLLPSMHRLGPPPFRFSLSLSPELISQFQKLGNEFDALTGLLSVLEAVYRPRLTHHIFAEFDLWQQFVDGFDPVKVFNWVHWSSDEVIALAERLVISANGLDPARRWLRLLRLIEADQWEHLRGDALMAMDHRIAAEMLFLFHEDLLTRGAALPPDLIPPFAPHPRNVRLTTDREELDEVLMEFGLSPMPSLVLFVEGETELLIIPRVIKLLGLPQRRSFIEVHCTHGNMANVGRFAMLVARPELRRSPQKHIRFARPPTQFLFLVDHEGPFRDSAKIQRKKDDWVQQIAEIVRFTNQMEVSQQDLAKLIDITTWGEGGCFEFAHFSDQELAEGVEHACRLQGLTPRGQIRESHVEAIRRDPAQNVEKLWRTGRLGKEAKKLSKLHLAEALWPMLEAKIRSAIDEGTQADIPVVRVIQRAVDTALRVHRQNVIIRGAEES